MGMDRKNSLHIINDISYDSSWSFYLRDNTLYYYKGENQHEKPKKLIDDVKLFDLSIDDKQRVHILCVINSGELIYIMLQKDICNKKILQSFPKEVNSIEQVRILSLGDVVHIFYDFRITGKNAKYYNYKSFIIHLYKTEHEWIQSYIGTFYKSINPKFFVDIDKNKNLYFFYLDSDQKAQYINSLTFTKKKSKWFNWKKIKLNTNNNKLLNIIIDSNNRIHSIFANYNCMDIYYGYTESSSTFNRFNKLIDCEETKSLEFSIFEFNSEIWIVWLCEEKIYYSSSKNFGETWSNILEFTSDALEKINYSSIDCISNVSKTISSFGFINDNETFILGITKIPEIKNEYPDVNTDSNELFNIDSIEETENKNAETNQNLSNTNSNIENEFLDNENSDASDILKTKEINNNSIWKKIANYLTLKE
ncbi:hypothetical protein SAMN02194393_02348 [Maledivibacter halophilus]|uniref:BNR repeat-containing family member n=2 Tax=Maledivibacter halophilus TaxID=36842 RepID=A0A1T5L202_9FIRM|nr:hypothetical protein SAMN02194393_02348 [Maledivibacter halophilus]